MTDQQQAPDSNAPTDADALHAEILEGIKGAVQHRIDSRQFGPLPADGSVPPTSQPPSSTPPAQLASSGLLGGLVGTLTLDTVMPFVESAVKGLFERAVAAVAPGVETFEAEHKAKIRQWVSEPVLRNLDKFITVLYDMQQPTAAP